MGEINTKETVENLRKCYAKFGFSEVVVTDNVTLFTSTQCTEFLTNNVIKFLTSSVCHSSSDGQAENLVKILKIVNKIN